MKKENSTLLKKLAQYSAMAAPMLALASAANSQIVYTDIDPDAVLSNDGDTLNLDLNNDGAVDYVFFTITGASFTYAGVYPYLNSTAGANEIAGTIGSYSTASGGSLKFGFPAKLDYGAVIDSNQAKFGLADILFQGSYFFRPAMLSFLNGGTYGVWTDGVTDKYVGFHFTIDGTNFMYGWARCDVSSDAKTLTVKDYAYETQAETAIIAGAGSVGINTPSNEGDVKIFSFEHQLIVNFQSANMSDASIRLFDVLGQEIMSQKVTSAQNVIDLKSFTTGTYLVQVSYNGKDVSKKILVN